VRVDLRQEIEQIYPFEFQISNFKFLLPLSSSSSNSSKFPILQPHPSKVSFNPSLAFIYFTIQTFFFASKNISTFFVIETQDQLKVLCEEDTLAKRGWFAPLLHLRQLYIFF